MILTTDVHAHRLARIFPRMGESGTAQDLIALLGRTRA